MLFFKQLRLLDDFFLIKHAVRHHISRELRFQHFILQYQIWLYSQQYQLVLSIRQQLLVLILIEDWRLLRLLLQQHFELTTF
jgi:hypothetical protein